MIASNFPAKYRTRANAIENAGYYIGAGLASLLVIVIKSFGWRAMYYLMGVSGFGLGLAMSFLIKNNPVVTEPEDKDEPEDDKPNINKPKSKIEIAMLRKEARERTIRKSLTIKVNPARPKPTPKRETPKVSTKPKRTVTEIRDTLKGKKVKTDEKMRMNDKGKLVVQKTRMDAQEYFDTKLAQKSAVKDQRNSVRATTCELAQERTAIANKKVARENRLERRRERRDIRRDVRAEKANPERYSSPKKELGNRIMSDRLVAIGEQSIKKAEVSKAAQRAKIAATPRVQKKVDATLDEAAKARAAAARRNRIDSRKITVRKKRGE
jgi:hypothetical protein